MKQEGYIYIIKSGKYYKIGRAKNDKERVKKYITENPNAIEIVFSHLVPDYINTEKKLHILFKKKQHRGEWFRLNNRDLGNAIFFCTIHGIVGDDLLNL